MAGHVGKLNVTLEGTDKSLSSTLHKSSNDVKKFAEQAKRDLDGVKSGHGGVAGGSGNASESAMGRLALSAKRSQMERRKSGEAALERMFSGKGGLSTAAGLGAEGLIAEQVGKAFASATVSMKKMASGEISTNQFVNQLATGIPILGQFVTGWKNVLSLIDGSAAAERELNQLTQANDARQVGIDARRKGMQERSDFEASSTLSGDLQKIEDERRARADELAGKRKKNSEDETAAITKEENSGAKGILHHLGSLAEAIIIPKWGGHSADEIWGNKYDENSAAAKETALPFEQNAAMLNAQEKADAKLAADERQKAITESLAGFDRSTAASRLVSAQMSGDPKAIVAARQGVARLNLENRLEPMDKEIAANAGAISNGKGLHGLQLPELKDRQKKVIEMRKAAAQAGEAQIAQIAVDEAQRKKASILGIDRGISAAQISIMESTAKTGEEKLAAQHQAITLRTTSNLKNIQDRLDDKTKPLSKDERDELEREQGAITASGKAQHQKLDRDDARAHAAAILSTESQIADGRVAIMMASATKGEDLMAAKHQQIADRAKAEQAQIDQKLAAGGMTDAETQKLVERRKQVGDQAAAESAKADRDEAKRRAASMLGMDHNIAQSRLAIQKFAARDSASVWAATEAGIKEDTKEKLDGVDEKLKDINLTEAERNKLLEERKVLQQEGDAHLKRAKEDYDRDVRRSQQSTAGSLIGIASNLLADRQGMPGGNNAAAAKMQKQLSIMGQSLGMKQQIEAILAPDSKATDAQKQAAREAQQQLDSWQKTALSEKNLNRQPYHPLQFAAAEEANSRFSGRAEFQKEQDESNYAKRNDTLEEQKETNNLLGAIVKMMQAGGGGNADNPLFPK